ncbi:hypothetical protein DV711_06085 [Motiliproteus coralliicola]|uniref:Uncharacterized protein n=1 Tax=Motiliproteus coralliicola TaxID=2283196 RepID=A0A369WX67_9GAMM|nr:hypothetical protein [Motiliproteus coralliicola]RDE25124.1 hypothetical protein DV711_06085 [Motiliproteus coralliicola]
MAQNIIGQAIADAHNFQSLMNNIEDREYAKAQRELEKGYRAAAALQEAIMADPRYKVIEDQPVYDPKTNKQVVDSSGQPVFERVVRTDWNAAVADHSSEFAKHLNTPAIQEFFASRNPNVDSLAGFEKVKNPQTGQMGLVVNLKMKDGSIKPASSLGGTNDNIPITGGDLVMDLLRQSHSSLKDYRDPQLLAYGADAAGFSHPQYKVKHPPKKPEDNNEPPTLQQLAPGERVAQVDRVQPLDLKTANELGATAKVNERPGGYRPRIGAAAKGERF